MASPFYDNIFVETDKLIDAKWGPFIDPDAAYAAVPVEARAIGMFAIIAAPNSPAQLYWYKHNVNQLVPFTGNSSVQVFDVKNESVPSVPGETFFPPQGSVDIIYVDKSTSSSYYWDTSTTPAQYTPTGNVQVYPKLLPNPDADPPETPGVDYFPLEGEENVIYVAEDTDIAYTWNLTTTSYIAISKGAINLVDNTGLEFDGENKLKTIYNTTISSGNSQAIGLLTSKSAAYWKTKNIVEVLNEILFPTTRPTYTPTTISLSHTLTLPYYEIGTSQTNNLTLTANKNDAGAYTNLSILREAQVLESVDDPTLTGNSYSISYSDSILVDPGTTTWTGNGDYLSGIVKNNSDNTPDTRTPQVRNPNAPQRFENDFDSNDVSINGIYPYYYGYSNDKPTLLSIATLVSEYTQDSASIKKVLRPLSNSEQVSFGATTFQYLWIAHTGVSKRNYITSTQPIATKIGTGLIDALFPTKETQNFTTSAWINIEFNVYISGYKTLPVNADSQIWFKFLD